MKRNALIAAVALAAAALLAGCQADEEGIEGSTHPIVGTECRAACVVLTNETLTRCQREGGDTLTCRQRAAAAAQPCHARCPQPPRDPRPPTTPPPPPDPCRQACGQAALDALALCVRNGGEYLTCRIDASEQSQRCAAGCPPGTRR
jgi:hypothetical protein